VRCATELTIKLTSVALACWLTIAASAPAQPAAGQPAAAQPQPAPPQPAPPTQPAPTPAPGGEKQDSPKQPAAAPAAKPEQADSELSAEERDEIESPSDARARARRELERPRPPLPDVEVPASPPWERLLEVGADVALVLRPVAEEVGPAEIKYQPSPGLSVHLHWPIIRWLRFHPYFVWTIQGLEIPQGALTVPDSPKSISSAAVLSDVSAESFSFGAKIAPTLPINERLRLWLAVGVGWGRFNYDEMTVTEPGGTEFTVLDRKSVFVEFPLGLGISFDVIERWLALEYEATAAPAVGQTGDAHEVFQAVDAAGNIRDVGPFGAIEVSIVQVLGLSLIL
jgi:hypothetical protein